MKNGNLKNKTSVLIVDDEESWRTAIRVLLDLSDYEIIEAETGSEALKVFKQKKPSLILLDLMLPDIDGIEVLKQMKRYSDTPVIVVSAKDMKVDIDLALSNGADDYILKSHIKGPKFIAKIEHLLKKYQNNDGNIFESGHLRVDFNNKIVFVNNKRITISYTEYNILELFAKNPNKLWTTEDIINNIWGEKSKVDFSNVRVYIEKLRRKIEVNPSKPQFLVTEHGRGYVLEVML